MKVACVFAGHFRTFSPFVCESFKSSIMEPLNADIYFSTFKTVFALPENEVPEFHHIHAVSPRLVGNDIIQFFGSRLKEYELRDQNSSFYKDIIAQHGLADKNFCNQYVWRTLSQVHSVEISMNLFRRYIEKHGLNYDLVILCRGDVKYYTRFDPTVLDMDRVNYPTHAWHNGNMNVLLPEARPSDSLSKAFNDQVVVGSQRNMLALCDLSGKTMEYVSSGVHFNTETLFGWHLGKNGIDWTGTNFITYELWRHERF
jgi:hypothetical protein